MYMLIIIVDYHYIHNHQATINKEHFSIKNHTVEVVPFYEEPNISCIQYMILEQSL